MTANKLFEDLGYEKINYVDNVEDFLKLLDMGFVRITFDKAKSTLLIIYDSGFSKYDYAIEQMEPEEQQAINTRIKELGWHFRQRKYFFEE